MRTTKLLLYAGLVSVSWAQVRVSVTVPANRAWTNTGISVDRGSTIVIDATGQIDAVSEADTRALFHRVPPEGREERQENKPQPAMRALVMLARIGNGPILEAGAHSQFTADRAGELQLGINDNNVVDNTGAWTAQVTVRSGGAANTERSQRNQDSNTRQSQNQDPATSRYPNNSGAQYPDDRDTRRNPAPGRDRSASNYPDSSGRNTSYPEYGNQRNQNSRLRADALDALDAKAAERGSRILGQPIADARTTGDGLGWYQEYRNAMIVWSRETGAHYISGDILQEWQRLGSATGDLGYPVSDEEIRGGTRTSRFQGGTITWTERNGVRVQRIR